MINNIFYAVKTVFFQPVSVMYSRDGTAAMLCHFHRSNNLLHFTYCINTVHSEISLVLAKPITPKMKKI